MEEEPIKCPKCGSTQIHVHERGFKTGRAIAGGLLTGNILIAAAAGATGKNKIELVCLKCGHKFNIGDAKKNTTTNLDYKPIELKYKENEFNTVVCSICGGKTLYSHKYCCQCGKLIDRNDKRILLNPPLSVFTCKKCNQISTKGGNYCSKCGSKLNTSKSSNNGCASIIVLVIILSTIFCL